MSASRRRRMRAIGSGSSDSHGSLAFAVACLVLVAGYTELLSQSIPAFLKHTADPPGKVVVDSSGSLSQADWIDWKAPTLQ